MTVFGQNEFHAWISHMATKRLFFSFLPRRSRATVLRVRINTSSIRMLLRSISIIMITTVFLKKNHLLCDSYYKTCANLNLRLILKIQLKLALFGLSGRIQVLLIAKSNQLSLTNLVPAIPVSRSGDALVHREITNY